MAGRGSYSNGQACLVPKPHDSSTPIGSCPLTARSCAQGSRLRAASMHRRWGFGDPTGKMLDGAIILQLSGRSQSESPK
jgi:hypothetical protein